jgi:hypothetical protein
LGNLSTPKSVQKLQMALHAKAKAEAGYRFYALYDKISLDDILAYAWAQCRSDKGAPGVDGQDFADVEAYGVQRWLGELALALRNEESLARLIVDARVLHLIKMWLECSVEETDDRGRKTRTTEAKDQRCGIPQGSSPKALPA